jgi:PPM family protein phosphatase
LTSHLGTPSLHRIDRSLEPYPLLEGDRVLICSDGLYRALDLVELAAPLAGAPQRACETLVERAVAKGHPRQDNMTALVIGLDADGVRSESGAAGESGVTVQSVATGVAMQASVIDVTTAANAVDVGSVSSAARAARVANVSTSIAEGNVGSADNVAGVAANVDIATLSRTAGRATNEDYADFLQAGPVGCWVIADGLGGHRGGATASRTVVQAALESFRQQPDISIEAVSAHVARAQDALLDAQQREPSLSQMRSTIVVLVAGDTDAVWAHVGDSRLYHVRGGQVIARTRDHSVGQALVDGGQIDAAAQGSHEDRSRLLRCLGKEGEASAAISGPHRLARGDVFLLCTDGFWEALDDVALTIDLAGSEDAAAWLDRLEGRLRRRIGPAHDNYTATAIRILNEALAGPPPHGPRASAHDAPVHGAAVYHEPAHVAAGDDVAARGVAAPARVDVAAFFRRARAPRFALAAAMALAAALVAAGVWKRAAIAEWMRTLIAPAAAITPSDRTPKKPPTESETKPDTKPDTKTETPSGHESDPASAPAKDQTESPSSSLSSPRRASRPAAKSPAAKSSPGVKNRGDVEKGEAAPDPAAAIDRPPPGSRPPAPRTPPPREEDR